MVTAQTPREALQDRLRAFARTDAELASAMRLADAYAQERPAADLGAAWADLESEVRVAVSLHCTGPGVPCELCQRETGRTMKAIEVYARDVADHERTREQAALAALRSGIAGYVDELKTSAASTHPSKKSQIQFDVIRRLESILEGK